MTKDEARLEIGRLKNLQQVYQSNSSAANDDKLQDLEDKITKLWKIVNEPDREKDANRKN